MNANELADDMEGGRFNDINYNKKKAADFVRQQQAEIEALKDSSYEKGFIDGMAKMTESAVHRAVEGMAAKELTDEEIRTIQAICHLKNVGYDNFIMRFARAILKKAQEK